MRITFLTPARGLVGGIKVMGEYAGRLRARGHDVTILYRQAVTGWLRRLFTRRVHDALDDSGCPLVGLYEFMPLDVPDADVIVATGLSLVRAAASFPREKGRLVEIVQGTAEMEESPAEARQAMAVDARRVAVSEAVAACLKTKFAVDAVVVPSGVDHALFHNADRQFRTPRSVGMIYVPGEVAGTADGFEAMRRVRERWPELRLVFFGAKRPRNVLPRAEVYVRPKTSRLRPIYSSCEIWLAPGRQEGFGLGVLEAMACGAVPVAARAGGHDALVEDNVSGFLVPVGDTEAMAARIGLLIEDESLLRRMSEAAHARSMAFDWERATDQLESLLKEWVA